MPQRKHSPAQRQKRWNAKPKTEVRSENRVETRGHYHNALTTFPKPAFCQPPCAKPLWIILNQQNCRCMICWYLIAVAYGITKFFHIYWSSLALVSIARSLQQWWTMLFSKHQIDILVHTPCHCFLQGSRAPVKPGYAEGPRRNALAKWAGSAPPCYHHDSWRRQPTQKCTKILSSLSWGSQNDFKSLLHTFKQGNWDGMSLQSMYEVGVIDSKYVM